MIAERLRKSILHSAIQGKLTEQLPEDGDASDLLAEIQSAKEKRIKDGSLKKDKVFHEITEDDKAFDIPENWCWVDLGDVFEIARGGSPRPIQAFLTTKDDGINWIKIGDTDIGGKYIDHTKEKIIPEGIKKSRVVNPGDLLLTNSMSFGRPYILNTRGCIHDGWLVLSPLSDGINREYFYYLLSTEFVRMAFAGTVAGAVVKNLNSDKVRVVTVPLPPVLEQERIVSRIEELLPYIEELEKDETKLDILQKSFPKKMKGSLLQSAIQGKLTEQLESDGDAYDLVAEIQMEKARLIKEKKIKKENDLPEITEDEIPFDIPENWCWVRLGDCLDVRDGTHDTPKYVAQGVPLVTSKNLNNGGLDFSTAKFISEKDSKILNSRSSVDDGDILFAMIGSIGNPALVKKDREFSIKNVALFKNINQIMNMQYAYYYLLLEQKTMKKVSSGGVQSFVSLSFLRKYLIPLPPLAEQHRIVERIDQLLPLCDTLE